MGLSHSEYQMLVAKKQELLREFSSNISKGSLEQYEEQLALLKQVIQTEGIDCTECLTDTHEED